MMSFAFTSLDEQCVLDKFASQRGDEALLEKARILS